MTNENQYKKGRLEDDPDEISDNNGTYRLWLNEGTRNKFYAELTNCFELLKIMTPRSSNAQEPVQNKNINSNVQQLVRNDNFNSTVQNNNFQFYDYDNDDDVFRSPLQSNPHGISPKGKILQENSVSLFFLLCLNMKIIKFILGLITEVHHLSTSIEQGNTNEAVQLASELAKKGVRLQVKSNENARYEKEFTYV